MEPSRTKAYDVGSCIAESYEQTESQMEDVVPTRHLLAGRARLRILEPFWGNGRIVIPLAQVGHHLVGLDKPAPMLASARDKVAALPPETRERTTLREADVPAASWPRGLDVIILGSNCLYEWESPEEQEAFAPRPVPCRPEDASTWKTITWKERWRQRGASRG